MVYIKPKIIKQCIICGNSFLTRYETAEHCSRKCISKTTRIKNTKLLDRECKECKKIFHPRRATTKFCSRKCQHSWLHKEYGTFYRNNMRKAQKFSKCQKISDEKMLEIWGEYVAGRGSISLELLFKRYAGYTTRPDKLKELVGEREYLGIMKKFNNKGRSRYGKGRRLEYKIRGILEPEGYYVVRSAGSKGLFDIVAIPVGSPKKIKLIQSKSNREPPKKEMALLREFNCPTYCEKEIWVWIDRKGFNKYLL